MKTDEIRRRFLEFFKDRGHAYVRSDSLVPQNDPTLLFTGAGMNQFKEYFLGLKKDLKRAVSCQKCLRTGDLDEVGRTAYHHSFFEMLGNFSFGDYFKREAVVWAWEFFTKELGIPKGRLHVSVHDSDKETYEIWKNEIKIPAQRITKLGDKSNFWPSNAPKDGPNGPCGPCSEVYYDQGENKTRPHPCTIEHDCGRFAEIWNLVFTQYDRRDGGKLVPLEKKNIDTGMGLERLACILQNKKTNFEIDIFEPINRDVRKCLKLTRGAGNHIYAISDHVRAVVFAMADGVVPSNEGRGYVIRKLIRRALWRAHQVLRGAVEKSFKEVRDPFLYQVAPTVVDMMKGTYPDLKDTQDNVQNMLRSEEERFLATLETGSTILAERIDRIKKEKRKVIPGDVVFELYDTYGFPDELTRVIADEQGLGIDQSGFDHLMEAQRKRGKQASQISSSIFVTSELEKKLSSLPASKFLGYQKLSAEGKVVFTDIREGKGIVVLDQTPFYAESGGQVGDQGVLENTKFKGKVLDTQKEDQCVLHAVEIEKGGIKPGDVVKAIVDESRRNQAMRNHTATHLLHAVLREIFGKQVRQLGSLVHPDRLRFDYSFSRALTEEEISLVERRVNEEILLDKSVEKEEKDFDQAKQEGAIAFFGEKYGDRVRVVTVPGISKEFCGGIHCEHTGQIGAFVITSETSIASGVRRMEALTGEGALAYFRKLRQQMRIAAERLKTSPQDLSDKITKLQERVKQLERGERTVTSGFDPKNILKNSESVGSWHLVIKRFGKIPREELRKISDALRSQSKGTIWLLLCQSDEKVHFLVGLSADLKNGTLDAEEIAKRTASILEGSGGGRKDLAEGGGPDPEALEKNWESISAAVKSYLVKKG